MTTHDLLALVGITAVGYSAGEIDDLLADGSAWRVEPVAQPDAEDLETEHRDMLADAGKPVPSPRRKRISEPTCSLRENLVRNVGWPGA